MKSLLNSEKTLVADLVTKKFEQGGEALPVLRGISQAFEQGTSYAIVGVSGSGKSTFMHILGGLDTPSSGRVELFGRSVHASGNERAIFLNKHLGFVFQFHYLIKELSVLENVMLPGLIGGFSYMDSLVRARDLLDFVGMGHRAQASPATLSGGEQQRISIVRAMFNKPAFLIADEPTGNLDASNADVAINLLLSGCKSWNMGLILCSHDQSIYSRMNVVFRMVDGILSREG